MLSFVGLGISGFESIPIEGVETISNADVVYLEQFTSPISETDLEKIKNSTNEYLVVGIGLNLFKSPNIIGYPTTNLFEITNKKINKKLFEKQLKITFEKFLSKYYKTN